MSSDHSTVVVDDSVEIVDGRLLHVFFMTDAELTKVQVSNVDREFMLNAGVILAIRLSQNIIGLEKIQQSSAMDSMLFNNP